MFRHISALFLIFTAFTVISAQTEAEHDAIKRTALNYAESWYEGSAAKMESSLSPDLAKRIARTNAQNETRLDHMTAMALVQGTRGGFGKQTPRAEQQKDVTIYDLLGGAATVKLEMRDWIDYMHVAKINGKWLIVNVLWEMKPRKETRN